MQVTVFGASGKVGQLVVAELLRRDHQVVAFVHNHGLEPAEGLKIIKGDIHDRPSVVAAVVGSDAVISTLGSWGTRRKDILSSAMQKIIPAMGAHNIKRVISLTGSGAAAPGETVKPLMKLFTLPLLIFAPKILRDGADHMKQLAASKLEWTVIRSPVMSSGGHISYKLAAQARGLTIHRRAVAMAMVDLAESGEWPRQAPYINRS